jgi:hypothetical protein
MYYKIIFLLLGRKTQKDADLREVLASISKSYLYIYMYIVYFINSRTGNCFFDFLYGTSESPRVLSRITLDIIKESVAIAYGIIRPLWPLSCGNLLHTKICCAGLVFALYFKKK